ncbi:MAG TPA: hypothetical protein VHS31_09055 [Tepidisphaeraceae bacterium]|jgi:galactokinase|nr:hypothetical protein [Tepidisphaeraceae bacterium]
MNQEDAQKLVFKTQRAIETVMRDLGALTDVMREAIIDGQQALQGRLDRQRLELWVSDQGRALEQSKVSIEQAATALAEIAVRTEHLLKRVGRI